MKCKKCGYSWEYKGKSKFYASCPRCRTNIKIKENLKGGKEDGNTRTNKE